MTQEQLMNMKNIDLIIKTCSAYEKWDIGFNDDEDFKTYQVYRNELLRRLDEKDSK